MVGKGGPLEELLYLSCFRSDEYITERGRERGVGLGVVGRPGVRKFQT